MSEFMLILSGHDPRAGAGLNPGKNPAQHARVWPPLPTTTDPETILLRLLACLRDLDRIDARLAAAYLETAIRHLRSQLGGAADWSETE